MKVLVTGAGGFIGSHVVDALIEQGHDVRAFIRYSSHGSWGWLEPRRDEPTPSLEVRAGDVTDPDSIASALNGCDAVLHLAALIGIPYSYDAPGSYAAMNIGGTMNLLRAAQRLGTSKIVITSTSEVYGTARYTPIDERHPLQAQSPYSASKIAADAMADAWGRSFELPVTVLRPFNTYGPRQSPRAVIPTIIGQLLSGATLLHLGRLDPRRDFTYVDDTVRGFVLALESTEAVGRTVHLGTGESISIGDLATLCMDITGVDAEILHESARERPPASEVEVLESDPSLAATLLNWHPKVRLRDGLTATVEWFRRMPPAASGFAR